MVSLIRKGPGMLLISTDQPTPLFKYFKEDLKGLGGSLNTLFDKAGEEDTIIVFTKERIEMPVSTKAVDSAVMLSMEMEAVLCRIINDGYYPYIKAIRTAPKLILLRGVGDLNKIIEKLTEEYPGDIGGFEELLSTHTDRGVIVALTDKSLYRTCHISDLYPQLIYIDQPYSEIYRELRADALKYLNEGIEKRDWTELEIRIFDRSSLYALHYQRLVTVINALELGIILGESWGKDSPRFMMTVDVYRVRFFTFMDPKDIKKILVGLEHLDNSMRIVDYDVYKNRKKIYWGDANRGEAKSRELLAALYRAKILEKLTFKEQEELKEMEIRIVSLQD